MLGPGGAAATARRRQPAHRHPREGGRRRASRRDADHAQAREAVHDDPEGRGSDAGFAEAVATAQAADAGDPGRRRDARDERRGRRAQKHRPPGVQEEPDREGRGDGQARSCGADQRAALSPGEHRGTAPAILEAWFLGGGRPRHRGRAVRRREPGGKLPVSFPRRSASCPSTTTTSRRAAPDRTQQDSRTTTSGRRDPLFRSASASATRRSRVEPAPEPARASPGASASVASTSRTPARARATRSCSSTSVSGREHPRPRRGAAGLRARLGGARPRSLTLGPTSAGPRGPDKRFVVEPGRIDVYAGSSSKADMSASFEVR